MTADALTVPNPLQPVDEDWQRGLAVVAHPDDLEFGAAAAIARWTRQGKEITYVLVTSGEAGIDGIDPGEAGPLREEEQRASAAIVREQVDGGLEKWGGVRQVWACGSPLARHAADTTDTFDVGVRSLEAHGAYLRGLGSGGFKAEEFLEGFSRQTGNRLGVKYAASFEVFRLSLY